MRIVSTPEFNDLFDGNPPQMIEILKGVSSFKVISKLSMINSMLNLKSGTNEIQLQIFRTFLKRQPTELQNKILSKIRIKLSKSKNSEVAFFSQNTILKFLHHELLNFRDGSCHGLTPEDEMKILKAYFVVVNEIDEITTHSFNANLDGDGDFFYKATWPTFIEQFSFNHPINPYAGMIRGLYFLEYLKNSNEFSEYLISFLKYHNLDDHKKYILCLTEFIKHSFAYIFIDGESVPHFLIQVEKNLINLVDNFSILYNEYKLKFDKDKSHYSGLKEKPLIKFETGKYFVLDWGFLYTKLYEGLIFDFHKHSGLMNLEKYSNLSDFKKIIAKKITEELLFQKLLTAILPQEHKVLLFDLNHRDSFPDCYYRDGNRVLLIEIKDAYFPSTSIDSNSFEKIKQSIDEKYNSKKKGTGQIIKQLIELKKKPFEDNPSYKDSSRLEIYPVIIYTDSHFDMPGVNRYLAEELDNKIKQNNLQNEYRKIHSLAFININFLIENIIALQKKENSLFSLIEEFNKFISVFSKKHRKGKTNDESMFNPFLPFHNVCQIKRGIAFNNKEKNVSTIFEVLDFKPFQK